MGKKARLKPVHKSKKDYLKTWEHYDLNKEKLVHEFQNELKLRKTVFERKIDFKPPVNSNIVLSTYFTTKLDPQRNIKIEESDFNYIKDWYNSIIKQNLNAIVFYDDLSEEFINEFQNKNIQFVKCELGPLSLNDERFIIYYQYILQYFNEIDKLIMTDINDVILLKNPFHLLDRNKRSVFVGRNHTNLFLHSKMNKGKIEHLKNEFGVKIPTYFYLQPVYNAGIIGGGFNVILILLKKINDLFEYYPSKSNMNMLTLNIALFELFLPYNVRKKWLKWSTSLLSLDVLVICYKLYLKISNRRWIDEEFTINEKDSWGNSTFITTSFPLHNQFKSYTFDKSVYIKHK